MNSASLNSLFPPFFDWIYKLNLFEWRIILIICLGASTLIIFNVYSKLAAAILIFLYFIIYLRNTNLNHLGDRALFIYLLWYLFSPNINSKKNTGWISSPQLWSLGIFFQIFITYAVEGYLKYITGWIQYNGMKGSLSEEQLVTTFGQSLLSSSDIVWFLTYVSFFTIIYIALAIFFDSFRKSVCLLGITYHLGSLFFFKLDWLPLALVLPFVLIWPQSDELETNQINTERKEFLSYSRIFSIVFIIFSLTTIPFIVLEKNRLSDINFFTLPFFQRWTGYAPPSSYSAKFYTVLYKKDGFFKSYVNGDFFQGTQEFNNLRVYKLFTRMGLKYYQNLRIDYLNFYCRHFRDDQIKYVELSMNWNKVYPQITNRTYQKLFSIKCNE